MEATSDTTLRFKEMLQIQFQHLKTKMDDNPISQHQANIVKLTLLEREVNNIIDILDDDVKAKQERVLRCLKHLKIKLGPTRKWFGQSEARTLINTIEEATSMLPSTPDKNVS